MNNNEKFAIEFREYARKIACQYDPMYNWRCMKEKLNENQRMFDFLEKIEGKNKWY